MVNDNINTLRESLFDVGKDGPNCVGRLQVSLEHLRGRTQAFDILDSLNIQNANARE
jgi:hypothetical protein